MGRIRRAWSSLFGPQAANNPADDRYFEPYPFAPNAAGIKVTPDIALKVAVVFRCVTILADTLATLPLQMYRLRVDGDPNGGMDPAPDHPIDDIIALKPNERQTPAEFWGMMAFHAALRGVAYAEIKPGPRGFANSLEPIHPDRVTKTEVLPDGTLRFRVANPENGSERILLQEEMFRIPGLTADGITGLRTVELASEAIGLILAADNYAARVFSNNLNIGGFLTHPGKLSKEAGDRLTIRLMQKFAGAGNAHRPAILQEGMKYEQAAMKANEAQLLEARKWQIGEVARYWGIPLHMLGIDDQTNRSTVEEQSLNFVRYVVKPWVVKVEQAIRRDLIIAPRRYVALFNLDGLERGNMQARAEYFAKALGAGGSPAWLTQNDVRVEEGWNRDSDPDSDKLAKGTNPSQQGASAPASKAKQEPDEEAKRLIGHNGGPPLEDGPAEPVVTEPAGQAVEAATAEPGTEARGASIVKREVTQIRKLAVRHAENTEAFGRAVKAFYGGFTSQVARELGAPKDAAREWCKRRADRVISSSDPLNVLEQFESEVEAAAATAA